MHKNHKSVVFKIFHQLFFSSINHDRFDQLAQELSALFSTSKDQFYWPYQKKNNSKQCVNAGGSLYEKYIKRHGLYVKYKLIEQEKTLSSSSTVNTGTKNTLFFRRIT